MSDGLSSRLCALQSLQSVFEGRKPFDISLERNAAKLGLARADKSFAHALCGFVLRYRPALQNAINDAAGRNCDFTPGALNIILLMGAAQIYLMDVPDHAAVDTAVRLTYPVKCTKQKGVVNAVLRRLIREGKKDLDPALPQWLLKTWADDYGPDTAQLIEQASLKEAKTGISNKAGEWHLAQEKDLNLSADEWVQDYASAMPVSLLSDLNDKHVLDLCAAPGGKTMQMAAAGAHVTSVDISEKRLQRLQENLKRTNLSNNTEIICADILKWEPQTLYDIILLDAPCSATGTIRRHPDLPYIRNENDIQSLVKLQNNLLDRIKAWLTPGGILVYCTCSIQKDEGERQIDRFLESNTQFKRQKIQQHQTWQTGTGDILLLPFYGDMDGFFISILIKQSD